MYRYLFLHSILLANHAQLDPVGNVFVPCVSYCMKHAWNDHDKVQHALCGTVIVNIATKRFEIKKRELFLNAAFSLTYNKIAANHTPISQSQAILCLTSLLFFVLWPWHDIVWPYCFLNFASNLCTPNVCSSVHQTEELAIDFILLILFVFDRVFSESNIAY